MFKCFIFLIKKDFRKFENFLKLKFPFKSIDCSQFLRHKTILINPYILKSQIPELKITKFQQNPGEIIITFSKSFHTGFNSGFNINEAVNFATPS